MALLSFKSVTRIPEEGFSPWISKISRESLILLAAHYSLLLVKVVTFQQILCHQPFPLSYICSSIHLHSWKSLACRPRQERKTDTTLFWMTSRTLNSTSAFPHIISSKLTTVKMRKCRPL